MISISKSFFLTTSDPERNVLHILNDQYVLILNHYVPGIQNMFGIVYV